MKNLTLIICLIVCKSAFTQKQVCNKVYPSDSVDIQVKWEDQSTFFDFINDDLLPIISNNLVEPPTSFRAILIIDDNSNCIAIKSIKENYPLEIKEKLLEKFQELKFESAILNSEKVCSEYYFVVSCIMYH